MKKSLILLTTLILIIIIVVVVKINDIQKHKQEILKYNEEFEYYCNKQILGTDITTLINKAISSNEANLVEKDEKGFYIDNNQNSIKKDSTKVVPIIIVGLLISLSLLIFKNNTIFYNINH